MRHIVLNGVGYIFVKFMYSEKAIKIGLNFPLSFDIKTQNYEEGWATLLWPSQKTCNKGLYNCKHCYIVCLIGFFDAPPTPCSNNFYTCNLIFLGSFDLYSSHFKTLSSWFYIIGLTSHMITVARSWASKIHLLFWFDFHQAYPLNPNYPLSYLCLQAGWLLHQMTLS